MSLIVSVLGLPVQLVQQWRDTSCPVPIICGPAGCSSLDHLNLWVFSFVWGSQTAEAYSSWGRTRVCLLDFFCSGIQFYLLFSLYLCFISFLYLDLYVLGDDALIS